MQYSTPPRTGRQLVRYFCGPVCCVRARASARSLTEPARHTGGVVQLHSAQRYIYRTAIERRAQRRTHTRNPVNSFVRACQCGSAYTHTDIVRTLCCVCGSPRARRLNIYTTFFFVVVSTAPSIHRQSTTTRASKRRTFSRSKRAARAHTPHIANGISHARVVPTGVFVLQSCAECDRERAHVYLECLSAV